MRLGAEALAAAVPCWPELRELVSHDNPGPSDCLWKALAAAFPAWDPRDLNSRKGFWVRRTELDPLSAVRQAPSKDGRPDLPADTPRETLFVDKPIGDDG